MLGRAKAHRHFSGIPSLKYFESFGDFALLVFKVSGFQVGIAHPYFGGIPAFRYFDAY